MRKWIEFIREVAEDERIPMQNRVVLGGLLLYLLTPLDLLPDFIPILGWLDDVLVTLLVLDYVFNSGDTKYILEHYPGNRESFERVKSYVERLAWLVPSRLKRLLFDQANRLALAKRAKDLPTPE